MNELQSGGEPKQFAGKVRRGADTGRAKAVFVRLAPNEVGELLHAFRSHIRIDDDDIRRRRRDRYRAEILDRIVRHLRVQARIDDKARARNYDRIAVGGGGRAIMRADIAAGPTQILQKKILAEIRREFCDRSRAITSTTPPGAKGTMTRTGWSG